MGASVMAPVDVILVARGSLVLTGVWVRCEKVERLSVE